MTDDEWKAEIERLKQSHKDSLAVMLFRAQLAESKVGIKPKSKPKSSIPALKPSNIHKFLSAIPKAVVNGEITASQGNGLLYAAQVYISLLRASTPHPPPPSMGFKPKGKK